MYQDEKEERKSGLYSIGAISEMTGLPVTAIRYYSEKKLIVPSFIDEDTGYRYFSGRHIWKLEIIKMYKQLGFSLSDIQALQETKQFEVLEQILEKSEQSILEKMEEFQETLANLSWLKEQCGIYRQAKSDGGFKIRRLPERRVLYAPTQSESDMWDLTTVHQKQITRELQLQKTIRRCYGYILKDNCLQEGELKIKGEYIKLDEYYSCQKEDLKLLPAGNYLCLTKTFTEWSSEAWLHKVMDQVRVLKINPDMIILEEVSLYLLSLEDTVYELQIRIPD